MTRGAGCGKPARPDLRGAGRSNPPAYPDLDVTIKEADVAPLQAHGWWSSMVQAAIGLLQPGVPDVYQGDELTDVTAWARGERGGP